MSALDTIRNYVKENKELPINLEMGYTVIFNTLTGNLPVNNRIQGKILDFPVDIHLKNLQIFKSPVNSEAIGTIGDDPIKAKLYYQVHFSTLMGNIPVNNFITLESNGKKYTLHLPSARAVGTGRTGEKSKGKSKKVHGGGAVKFKGGQMVESSGGAEGGGSGQEGIMPVPKGLSGIIEDIEIDIRFHQSYYISTSSGRTPINVKATGYLRDIAEMQAAQ